MSSPKPYTMEQVDELPIDDVYGSGNVAAVINLPRLRATAAEVARLTTALAMAECNDERADLKLEVARLTTRLQTNAENHETAVQGMLNQLASQRAEYETALALVTDTVRDLTTESDAAREEAVEACAQSVVSLANDEGFYGLTEDEGAELQAAIRATPHSTALRDRIRELEASLVNAQARMDELVAERDQWSAEHDTAQLRVEELEARVATEGARESARFAGLVEVAESALAAETAAHAATREALKKDPPCDAHFGRRRACGQCHDSLAAHVRDLRAQLSTPSASAPTEPRVDLMRVAGRACAATAEPATPYKCPECNSTNLAHSLSWRCSGCGFSDALPSIRSDVVPTFTADDLRKVAEAGYRRGACFQGDEALCDSDVREIDAIIAKAVGR